MTFNILFWITCRQKSRILYSQTWNSTTGIAIIKGEVIAKPQPLYGIMTLIPVLLAFTLTTLHWYQTEESSKRLRTLPLLLAQIWPQYRVGRILWLYKKGDDKWIKEKELIERKLSSLGEFLFEHKHTGISCQNFFHSTIIPPWKVFLVSREVDKLKEL